MKINSTVLFIAIVACTFYNPVTLYAEESSSEMEEVVVTSRRRDESAQDVPLSVTAFGSERIDQLKPTTLRDFDGLAPNVYIGMNTAGPGASALYIRGIGYADIEKTQSPQVGVIVDGIQMGSSTGQLIDTFDVESIEINRGPQGVLFGKNTIGGNIVVNRVKPRFNDFGVNASVEAGNYNSRQLKVRLNVPLIEDELALKVGVIDRSRDGFYMNENIGGTAGDVDFRSITAALRWAPSDIFEATLTYDNIDDTSQIPPQDPRYDGSNPFITLSDKREPTTYDVDQVGIRATLELSDNVTLHSITGWHDGADGVNQDFDGAGVDGLAIPFAQLHTLREQQFEVLTQEVRITGSFNDNLDFMVGYYYYDSELDFKQRTNNILQLPAAALGLTGVPCAGIPAIGLILPFRANPTVGDVFCQFPNAKSTQLSAQDVVSDAFFGSITWRPNDALEIMLGMRYIEEETTAQTAYYDHSTGTFDTGGVESEHDFSGLPSVLSPNGYDSGDYWEDTIFTTSISYAFTGSNRVYASYSEGFRSGGFSIRSARAASEAPFDPETADQVEIGSKNELLDGKLHLNIAYYRIDREGGQFSSIISLPPGSIPGTTTIINNGGTSTTDGWELESRWMINENFTLLLNYGSLNADNGTVSIACEYLDGCVSSVPGGANDPAGTIRTLGGNSDSRQPESTFAVNLAFDQEMGSGTFYANVGYKKTGEYLLVNTGAGAENRTYDGDYGQVDARIAYDMQLNNGSTLSLSLFGKNLTDELYREQALFLGGGTMLLPSGGPNTGFQGWGAPRTYAFEVRYSM